MWLWLLVSGALALLIGVPLLVKAGHMSGHSRHSESYATAGYIVIAVGFAFGFLMSIR